MERFSVPYEQLRQFCRRWKISELSLFGSMLRPNFGPGSDIDLLATFADDAEWGLLDHVAMQQELEAMLNRNVDLVSKRGIEASRNHIRRNAILGTAQALVTAHG